MKTEAELNAQVEEISAEVQEWIDGKRSWTNDYPNLSEPEAQAMRDAAVAMRDAAHVMMLTVQLSAAVGQLQVLARMAMAAEHLVGCNLMQGCAPGCVATVPLGGGLR